MSKWQATTLTVCQNENLPEQPFVRMTVFIKNQLTKWPVNERLVWQNDKLSKQQSDRMTVFIKQSKWQAAKAIVW